MLCPPECLCTLTSITPLGEEHFNSLVKGNAFEFSVVLDNILANNFVRGLRSMMINACNKNIWCIFMRIIQQKLKIIPL